MAKKERKVKWRNAPTKGYSILSIPKGQHKWREVYVPYKAKSTLLNKIRHRVYEIADFHTDKEVVHGFVRGRSYISNAYAHAQEGNTYYLSFDLEDFFNTVTWEHVHRVIPKFMKNRLIVDGSAKQGLCTSPAVANIAMRDIDYEIKRQCIKRNIKYTRYADDMTFSFNELKNKEWLESFIPAIVKKHKFKVNENKTEFQDGMNSDVPQERWVKVTGVRIMENGELRLSRKQYRDSKTAAFQLKRGKGNYHWQNGVIEMAKLKLPKEMRDKN